MKIFALLTLLTLSACGTNSQDFSLVRSLTGDDYTGQKYYTGWGAAAAGDPSMMHNEVRFDVEHTHEIFTADVGGTYVGTADVGSNVVNRTRILDRWNTLAGQMTNQDMFVQYSSGHGSRTGLAVGVTYNEIRDNALRYPAKEIIIFTMACLSGNLVNSFNNVRDQWADFAEQGRTLLVMASSRANENSSTGPGRDPDEPGGPNGSAGSAFGHALWKSLIGYADGYVDGVKDGYISLDEIVQYSTYLTEDIGGHTPVSTGVYNGNLVMNRVPPRAWLETLEGSTEGLSNDEIRAKIAQLDAAFRLQ
jgi:hypothetical protein